MTNLFRRAARRRAQQVASTPLAFDDSRDFIREQFSDAGEPLPALTSVVAPRPFYVHRSRVNPDPLVDSLLTLENFSNDLDLVLRRRRVAWGAQKAPPLVQSRFPLYSPRVRARVQASFAELNRLRLDPRTAVCVRRRTRREVLFARRVAGGRGMRSYRRNEYSQWSC